MGRSRNDRNGTERKRLTRRLRALGNPCGICGEEIDYSLRAGDDWAFECDEIVPVKLGGSELEWANLQASHRVCNRLKGARLGFTLPCKPPRGARLRDVESLVCGSSRADAAERAEFECSQSWFG